MFGWVGERCDMKNLVMVFGKFLVGMEMEIRVFFLGFVGLVLCEEMEFVGFDIEFCWIICVMFWWVCKDNNFNFM